jgi:hypothetical protein
MTINWLWPMTLVLLSIPLLKQKIKLKSIIAITISFFGAFIIATRGNLLGFKFTNPTGILLALGSTIIWALFWIYNTKDKHDEAVRLFLNFMFGSVFIFISILLFNKIKVPDFKGILGAVYIGLFEMGITFLLWLKALKLSKTTAHVANLVKGIKIIENNRACSKFSLPGSVLISRSDLSRSWRKYSHINDNRFDFHCRWNNTTETLRESLKIAFVTKTSEIFSGKAEGQNRRSHSQSYVEDEFWPDNAVGGNCSRLQ